MKKFLKLNSKLTSDQISDILHSFSPKESRDIRFLYLSMPHVNFTDDDGTISMYIVVDPYDVDSDWETPFDKLKKIYKDKGMDFTVEDLSKDILMGKDIKSDYTTTYGDIGVTTIEDEVSEMVEDFYKETVTIDHILDKMNESGKGVSVLSDFDKSILAKGY